MIATSPTVGLGFLDQTYRSRGNCQLRRRGSQCFNPRRASRVFSGHNVAAAPARAAARSPAAVLELFSGTAELSRAFSSMRHVIVLRPIDILSGSEYDLTNVRAREEVLSVIRGGGVGCVHMGLPCRGWAAFRAGRSSASARGAEKERVRLWLSTFCVKVVRACDSLSNGWSMENPANSGLWSFPPVARLIHDPQNHAACFQSCYFGDAYRRNIMILSDKYLDL